MRSWGIGIGFIHLTIAPAYKSTYLWFFGRYIKIWRWKGYDYNDRMDRPEKR